MAGYDKQPNLGALICFRPGISKADARRALQSLNGMVQNPYGSDDPADLLREWDGPDGPVWYIP